eukprot:TRINITY_DN4682_c0_g1_i1.p1 TRINITY_DN4682_c0_g1~~TRINITY_DN4682_c0_g1_i1.p1  ORF type:complete len:246 (-),score=39.27 TRINITY_DN4682_c0_g1_i1:116-853(-)
MWREAYEGQWELEWGDSDEQAEWSDWEEDGGEDFSVEQRLGLEAKAGCEGCYGETNDEWPDWTDNCGEQDTSQAALVGRPKAASIISDASSSLSRRVPRGCMTDKQVAQLGMKGAGTKKRPVTGAEAVHPPGKTIRKSVQDKILQGHSDAQHARVSKPGAHSDARSARISTVQKPAVVPHCTAVKSAPAKPPQTAVKSAPAKLAAAVKSAPAKPLQTAVKSAPAKPPRTAVKSAPTKPPNATEKL